MKTDTLTALKQHLAAYQLAAGDGNGRTANIHARAIAELLQNLDLSPLESKTAPASKPHSIENQYGVPLDNLRFTFCASSKFAQQGSLGRRIEEGEPYFFLGGNFKVDEVPESVRLASTRYQQHMADKARIKAAPMPHFTSWDDVRPSNKIGVAK